MKNWVNKIINRIKQWRLVGYIILAKPLIDIHGMEQGIIEIFLLVVLGEISARTKKKTASPEDIQKEIDKVVERGRD
jgi:hypothetical protein